MGAKIGQLLVESGLIVAPQLEQALQAQLVFGGRLGTNLVELGFISTATLAAFLSQQLSIPALSPGELDTVEPEALAAVDAEMASRHLVLPLSLRKRRLRLAMADPTDLAAADEIGFRTGYGVDAVVAPELLVHYALERFYGVTKANRFVRVADSMREAAAQPDPDELILSGGGAPAASPKEPFDLKRVAAELASAESYGVLLEVARRALAQDLRRVAIFTVEREVARGWCQKGCTIPSEVLRDGVNDPFRQIKIPVKESRVFWQTARSEGPRVAPLQPSEADRILLSLLGVGGQERVLAFALRVGQNVAAFALGVGERHAGILGKPKRYEMLSAKLDDAIHLVHLRKRILSV